MSDPSAHMSEWARQYKMDMMRRREAALQKFAREVVPGLAATGIRIVSVEYSGYGDSGAIDCVEAYGDGDEELVAISQSVRSDIEVLAYELMPGGFENNEGGEGTIKLDLVKGTYQLHHGQRVLETEWSDEEGKF